MPTLCLFYYFYNLWTFHIVKRRSFIYLDLRGLSIPLVSLILAEEIDSVLCNARVYYEMCSTSST